MSTWPLVLSPQQTSVPSVFSPQVWASAARATPDAGANAAGRCPGHLRCLPAYDVRDGPRTCRDYGKQIQQFLQVTCPDGVIDLGRPLPSILRSYVGRLEVEALLAAPDRSTRSGHRDQMFTILYNTGARVSEAIGLRRTDVEFDGSRCVHIRGKGRKQRVVPLWSSTVARLKEWIARMEQGPEAPLFPNRDGRAMSRSGVEKRLRLGCRRGRQGLPEPGEPSHYPTHPPAHDRYAPPAIGVDMTVLALWLGHETPATTRLYVEADLTMKEQALKRVAEPASSRLRYQAKDRLLAFLDRL